MKQNENLDRIKEVVHSIVPDAQIILFGSRARGTSDDKSDYDIMITLQQTIRIKDKIRLSTRIRKALIQQHIYSDIIIQSVQEIEIKKDFLGSVVRTALREGIPL